MICEHYPELDETLYRETLENGLPVLVIPRKGFTKKIACFVTDYGSIQREITLEGQEYHAPAGVAPFFEPNLFERPG